MPQKYKSNKKNAGLQQQPGKARSSWPSRGCPILSWAGSGTLAPCSAPPCPLIFLCAFGRGIKGHAGNETTMESFLCMRAGRCGVCSVLAGEGEKFSKRKAFAFGKKRSRIFI